MRNCCQEYANAMIALEVIKADTPEYLRPWVTELIRWVKARYEQHVDEAGEAAWAGD